MEPTIYCYDKCTTCKKALKFLDEHDVKYHLIPVYENPPTKEDFLTYFKESDLPSRRFFNTSGMVYREMHLKDKVNEMSDEQKAELLSSDGRLVKRPLLVLGDKVFPGFREKQWCEILGIDEG